jgi:hypothetical protein
MENNVQETSYLYVWKVSPPYVYFRLKLTKAGVDSNEFVKMDTSTNSDMIRNLQKRSCAKTLEITGTTSLSVRILGSRDRVDNDTQTETETTYRITSDYPAFFGSLNQKRVKKTLNNSGTVTKTENFDYVISSNANTTQPDLYTDSTIKNPKFCVMKGSAPVPPETLDVYAFPFVLDCEADVSDFDPSVEL